MTELIGKKLLMETIGIAVECKDCKRKGTFGCNESSAFAYACEMITETPPVDSAEVVRCKDCKYFLDSSEKCGILDTRLHFNETDKRWTGDCFCSWAERREE